MLIRVRQDCSQEDLEPISYPTRIRWRGIYFPDLLYWSWYISSEVYKNKILYYFTFSCPSPSSCKLDSWK